LVATAKNSASFFAPQESGGRQEPGVADHPMVRHSTARGCVSQSAETARAGGEIAQRLMQPLMRRFLARRTTPAST